MATSPELRAHQDWIGLVQPVGLVVAPAALLQAGVVLPERLSEQQDTFRDLVRFDEESGHAQFGCVKDLLRFLDWPENYLVQKTDDTWGALQAAVPEYSDTLQPSFAVVDPDNAEQHIILIKEVPDGADLDATGRDEGNGRWHASHQARLERLLKATHVPIGLLFNGLCVRLVYAPQGESSGYLTFPFKALCTSDNKPMLGALLMLLRADRLFTLGTEQRLPSLLKESRKYQNTVTEKLADQVLAALTDLLAGLQVADKNLGGSLLRDVLKEQPQLIYEGLVSVMMRLVFLLYSEERAVLPQDAYYLGNYSILKLFERLRDDDALHSDTMEQRYGAWAQLMTLFRMVFEGIKYEAAGKKVVVPPRQGDLFNPDRFPFLEGRPLRVNHSKGAKERLPMVPDGTVLKVLCNLLILDGERISYRTLDVEQIGSVYEALMGFELSKAEGPSLALKPDHVVVNLKELLAASGAAREKLLNDQAGVKLTGETQKALKSASTVEELAALLDRRRSHLTPDVIPVGGLFFQVTHERRRSGSHYTPRSLTEPIVDTTLTPLVDALGPNPTPAQILDLKVCDPAMGSGAFLVAACRWLGDRLLAAWQTHGMPRIPADEDPVLHARRMVSLNCLYGVDKNPFAVNLAKLSLWLATLAKDHPFTFLDHALKKGDSLVGLDVAQISFLSWDASSVNKQVPLAGKTAREAVKEAEALRAQLRALGDGRDMEKAKYLHSQAEDAAQEACTIGDHVVAAFFGAENAKGRVKKLDEVAALLNQSKKLCAPDLKGQTPFHWPLEFPEVFDRANEGFDAFVGNPPFAGKNNISDANGEVYLPWLQAIHVGAHGNADLSAHFFRRCFLLTGSRACVGMLATNTIAQGDTRATGLLPIIHAGGVIYDATRSMPWPGLANVAVSVVHLAKGLKPSGRLDGQRAKVINTRLRGKPERPDPVALAENANLSFQGSIVLGMGFTLTPEERDALVKSNRRNAERIFPYLGGEEVNTSPTQTFDRYVISFGDMPLEEAEKWPDLLKIIQKLVRPERDVQKDRGGKEYWWRFLRTRPEMYAAIKPLKRCLVTSIVTKHLMFSFQPTDRIFSHKLQVFALERFATWASLQTRLHVAWTWELSSTMRNDLNYSASDCFETFPFPPASALSTDGKLEKVGAVLYLLKPRQAHGGTPAWPHGDVQQA